MDNLIISAVPITLIEVVWPQVEPLLQKAVDHAPNDTTTTIIKAELLKGSSMLLVVCDGPTIIASCYVEAHTYDTGYKVLYMPVLGGDRMSEWLERMNIIVNAIAIDMGCEEIRAIATRAGWVKAIKHLGWNRNHEILSRKVEPIVAQNTNITELRG